MGVRTEFPADASGGSTTPGSRCPTAPGWPRASGCRTTPRPTRCRRSSSTCRTARATATARRDSRPPPVLRRPRLRRGAGRPPRHAATPTASSTTSTPRQEQDDALEVLAWLAAQPWCTGARRHVRHLVGRLQRPAGRRAPAAGAEGRHHALLDRRPLRRRRALHAAAACSRSTCSRGPSTMLTLNARPPDPAIVGDGWREMWLERLERTPAFVEHVARATSAATTTGGTARSARTTRAIDVPRSTRSAAGPTATRTRSSACSPASTCPRKGLIGPWSHAYPHDGEPGPAIGFLQETRALVGPLAEGRRHRRSWTSRCCASGCRTRCRRPTAYDERPGRWVGEERLAVAADRAATCTWPPTVLGRGRRPTVRRARAACRPCGGRARASGAPTAPGRPRRSTSAPRTAARSSSTGAPLDGARSRSSASPEVDARARRRPAARARRRPALRRRARRRLAARHARPAQPHPPRRPRRARAARARARATACGQARRHRPRVPAGHRLRLAVSTVLLAAGPGPRRSR